MLTIKDKTLSSCLLMSIALTGFLCSGCGGGKTEPTTVQTDQPTAAPQNTNTPTTQTSPEANVSSSTPKVDPQRMETKWIGQIPYDIFYDQPLSIAADTTLLGGDPVAANVGNSASPTQVMPSNPGAGDSATTPATLPSASASTVNWAEIIPMEVLVAELKSIRTNLTTNLQTVATYNRSAKAIALDGSIVAALGAITTVHPEADTWKDRGKFIRDLGYAIYSASGESGRAAFQSTEDPFLKLQTTLDGGVVAGLEAEESVPFSDVAYVAEMMQRIEFTFNNLKANINTEARMKEDPAAVLRDLHMLAAMGSLMGTESYDNADAKKYQEFVSTFVGGAMQGVVAVKSDNYDGFRDGLNKIQGTCSECHQQYKGSDSGF